MTVAEFINFWNSVNTSTVPISYYYKGERIYKHKLYNINCELNYISLKYIQEDLTEYDVNVYHESIDRFNYDQQEFFNGIRVEVPQYCTLNTIAMYLE